MTIATARRIYRDQILSTYSKEQKKDKIAINADYMMFLDNLCQDGDITYEQYFNASNYYKR